MTTVADRLGLGPKRVLTQLDDGNYKLTVTPPAWSGFTNGSEVILTEDQKNRYEQWLANPGTLIQDLLSDLSPSQRESIMSGINQDDWEEAFKDDEY